jgi:ribosomal protein S18 acetylase RimI-like enzyme
MFDTSIEYKSIIMRCDQIYKDAYRPLPPLVSIEFYTEGMESIWMKIQREAGEFSQKTDAEVLAYFKDRFGSKKELLKERCLFLKDNQTGRYIGTCMAWEAKKNDLTIPILHWLAVSDAFGGQGFARILITLILKIFENTNPNEAIYLHTQPSSYPAIKLYHDFGFRICRTDTYGTAINEYQDAKKVLEKVMTQETFQTLISDAIS